jgi:predicted Zn-dependent protease
MNVNLFELIKSHKNLKELTQDDKNKFYEELKFAIKTFQNSYKENQEKLQKLLSENGRVFEIMLKNLVCPDDVVVTVLF